MAGLETLASLGGLNSGLEVGQVSQPWNVPVAGQADAGRMGAEVGATGTPIFGGFLRELGEYNANLTWPAAYMVYEQMRRGDAMVAATLSAIKLPIRCAEWHIQVPDDATAVEKEAAKFCESCLFEEMDFRGQVLDNALLQLDFGASMHEDVWYVDGNASRIRLRKLAPRLPLTWFRWLTKPGTDELAVIEQLGYRAGNYVRTDVPLDKAALFTFRQEGANFTGRALLREMYPHWYTKWALYKIDAIACERNGMGVPTIKMGETGRGRAEAEDRANALEWVQQLTAHERTGLLLPPGGWEFSLEGVKGTLRDPKDSIEHHNRMIAIAGLVQFMLMGQGQHSSGNRSLGQTMSDFFFLSLQALADSIGRQMSLSTIKRLVDLNFDGITNYPKLTAQQILAVNFQDVMESLKDLAASAVDLVRPDDELEAWIRSKIGAPKAGEPRLRVAAPMPAFGAEGGEPGGGPGSPQSNGGGGGSAEKNPGNTAERGAGKGSGERGKGGKGTTGPGGQAKQVTGSVAGAPAAPALKREARGAEKFLAAGEIISRLDQGRDELAAALRAARPRVQAEIIHKLVDAPVRNMHRVSVAPDEKLTAAVEETLRGIAAFGKEQVGAERARAKAGKAEPKDAAEVRQAVVAAAGSGDSVGLYADGLVSEFANNLQARAANLALDKQRSGGKTKGELIQEIGADLDDQSDKWIDSSASKGANEAFADGRQEGYEQYKDEIGSVIYSALLDLNTCETCAGADGQEGDTPEDIPDVPNPDCDGGDKCRCVHVYVFSDEVKGAK